MNKTLTIIFAVIVSYSHAQERRRKSSDSEFFSRTYHVLKSNKSIMDGPYEYRFKGKLIEEGQYDNGNPSGIWTFYNAAGEVSHRYDFTNGKVVEWNKIKYDVLVLQKSVFKSGIGQLISGKLVPYDNYTEKEFAVVSGSTETESKLDRPPLLLASNVNYQFLLHDILRKVMVSQSESSLSMITFVVDEEGNMKDFAIASHSSLDFEQAFVDELKKKQFKWAPAQIGGKNVSIRMRLPIVLRTDREDYPFNTTNIFFEKISFLSDLKKMMESNDKDYAIHLERWDYKRF